MSEIITVRDLAMVTSDIQYAQRQGARQLASNLIEIGRLLVEAKTMVDPKDWEKYIWDNFGYSTSSADNWMKLYKEYGNDQESLFDSFTNSQAFGRLSYTKLLALTAIPPEDREAFVADNHVEDLSTRQLQQLIKERDEAMQAKEAAEQQLDAAGDRTAELEAELTDTREDLERARNAAQTADQEAKAYHAKLTSAEKEKARAAESEKNALAQVDKLKKQLAESKEKAKTAQEALRQAKEKPEIPESVMEQMRKEVEADAAQKVTADLQKQLTEAQAQAAEAAKAKAAAEEKLAAAQKAVQMANPDVAVFQTLYIQLQENWNRAVGAYQKVRQADETTAANCHRALTAAIEKFRSDIA